MSKIRVLIADDHTLVRSGLRLLIEAQDDMEVVGEAGNFAQTVDQVEDSKPDVLTFDLAMPGGFGVAGIEKLRQRFSTLRIVVLSMYDDPAFVRTALAMGAAGYVAKSAADTGLISAIRAVHAGRVFVDAENVAVTSPRVGVAGNALGAPTPIETLSHREREVLALVASGLTNQAAAEKLGLSVKTVESYRARLMEKLSLTNRAELTRVAIECGLLQPQFGRPRPLSTLFLPPTFLAGLPGFPRQRRAIIGVSPAAPNLLIPLDCGNSQARSRTRVHEGRSLMLSRKEQGIMKRFLRCTVTQIRLLVTIAAVLSMAVLPTMATASVFGFLGNFDVINDTGQPAYGFEIELEDLHISDISDVFGGPGRGFPTGRGFDPATSVERYGAPSITEYTNGAIFGTKVTYSAIYDGMSWDFSTPSGNFITPGDNCWSGGGVGYGPGTPCDHFGVGTRKNPTKTTYSWLHEVPGSPGVLTSATGIVQLPPPVWNVIPDPVNPAAPPQVVAQIEAPDPPPQFEFGDALWVKVFTTEFEDPTELEDLVGDNAHVQQAETEVEWQLLQKEFNNPLSGKLESGYGVPIGPNAQSILRRYEFYEFSGVYDEESHEALFDAPFGDSNPGPDDVGTYLGSQNAALNIIPEPASLVLAVMFLAVWACGVRPKR